MGAPNGVSRRTAFDRWLRYPAGFSPATLTRCFSLLPQEESLIIDPFAGVATTGTRAIVEGHKFRGIEAHPVIAGMAGLKFTPLSMHTASELERVAKEMVLSLNVAGVRTDAETSLVSRSFEIETLRELVALRESVNGAESRLLPYLRCALIGCLRDVASVKVGWPYQQPGVKRKPLHRSVTRRFVARVKWLIEDLALLPEGADASIIAGDARNPGPWHHALQKSKATACVSSPPYLNNFDYADATRLELYFMGAVHTWAELCKEVRSGMVAATTQQSTRGRAEAGWAVLRAIPKTERVARTLERKLNLQRRMRPRGKEYDQMLPAYLGDIFKVLRLLYQNIERGGVVAWVIGDSAPYGVYIDTPRLISGMAAEIGFTAVKDINLRARGKRWANNGTRHQVKLSERLLVLQS